MGQNHTKQPPTLLNNLGWVGLGGFLGAIARAALAGYVVQATATILPVATLTVNLLGSLGLACLFGLMASGIRLAPGAKLALTTGFFGSFTTFSTISLEAVNLWQSHGLIWWLTYELVNITGGLTAAALGYLAGQKLGSQFTARLTN